MTISRKKAWAYAEQLLSRPRRDIPVTLRHGKRGIALLHNGRVLTRCYASKSGQLCAPYVAQALGLELPLKGERAQANVSTGVLYRAISIASLDLRIPEAYILLERYLEEAEFQRAAGGEPVI